MTNAPSHKKPGGRPLSYAPELVYAVVEQMLLNGMPAERIDAALVKDDLCRIHGVKSSIRLDSLQRLVDTVIAELQASQNHALVASLPEAVSASIDHFMTGARDVFATMVAEQYEKCRAEAQRECEELKSDRRSTQYHIAELEAENARLQEENQRLAEERDHCAADAASLREQLKDDKVELARLRGATDLAQILMQQLQGPGGNAQFQSTMTPPAGEGDSDRQHDGCRPYVSL